MKRTKVLIGVLFLIIITMIVIGCKKAVNTETKKTATKNGITSRSVIDKVIDKYKEESLADIRFEATNALTVDKNNKIDIAMVFHNYFIDNDMKKCITNLNFKLIVDKTKNHINMYMNEYGNIAYALNNKIYYSADDMYSMLGIKYSAPEMEIEEVTATDSVEPTEDIYKIDGTLEDEDEEIDDEDIDATKDTEVDIDDIDLFSEDEDEEENVEESSVADYRKTYTLDHLSRLSNRVILKGNKEVNGKDCYVLKGLIDSIEIRNILVTYLETGLYTIPKDIGDVEFEIYVDKSSYEIYGVTFDCGKVISTLTGNEEVKNNLLEFKMTYNTGMKLAFPKVKASTVECYDAVLTAMDNISKAIKK